MKFIESTLKLWNEIVNEVDSIKLYLEESTKPFHKSDRSYGLVLFAWKIPTSNEVVGEVDSIMCGFIKKDNKWTLVGFKKFMNRGERHVLVAGCQVSIRFLKPFVNQEVLEMCERRKKSA